MSKTPYEIRFTIGQTPVYINLMPILIVGMIVGGIALISLAAG